MHYQFFNTLLRSSMLQNLKANIGKTLGRIEVVLIKFLLEYSSPISVLISDKI